MIDIDGQGLRPITLGQAHLSKQLLQLDFLIGDPTSQDFTEILHFYLKAEIARTLESQTIKLVFDRPRAARAVL